MPRHSTRSAGVRHCGNDEPAAAVCRILGPLTGPVAMRKQSARPAGGCAAAVETMKFPAAVVVAPDPHDDRSIYRKGTKKRSPCGVLGYAVVGMDRSRKACGTTTSLPVRAHKSAPRVPFGLRELPNKWETISRVAPIRSTIVNPALKSP